MTTLLEALTNLRHTEPERIVPRFSRKTQRITVTVYMQGVPRDASLPIMRLDRAIDRGCSVSDGTGPPQRLLDELLSASQKFGHVITGKKKHRGSQSGRELVLYRLQYAS